MTVSHALRTLRYRARRGQIAVMSFFFLITMIYTAGMFVNVSQAITRKIEAQMICDAAAFTGATYQAKGLNALTKTNRIIGGLYATYWTVGTWGLGPAHLWPHEAFPNAIAGVFESVIQIFRLLADFQNIGYAGLAYSKAKENAEHNIKYFFNVDNVGSSSIKSYGGNYWCKEFGPLGRLSVDPLIVQIPAAGLPVPALTADSRLLPFWGTAIQGDFDMNYIIWCWVIPCGIGQKNASPPLWVKNTNKNEELRFYWVIQLPETRAMFMPNVYKIPPVTAVGSAKAFGGTRGPDDHDDMESVAKMSALAGLASGDDGGEGFLPKYRARLCPTSTDFILHFYLFGPQWYRDNSMLPSLWGGVIH
ncbi:MAG: hypothetical protein GEEBNDBF_00248 [bacterium]|nr:hypothetical protein [bacterium]